ncbi:MAG: GC-type dockerin domain-anchored protein [Phycisphaerales bacterium]
MRWRLCVVTAVLVCAPAMGQSLRVIASAPGSDVNVPSTGATDEVTFSGVAEPVAGFGVVARFTSPVADQQDGLYPWSSDFAMFARAPGAQLAFSPTPWFGDRSFVDYPVSDAFGGFFNINGNGTWTVAFDSGVVAPFVAGLREVTYYLLADTKDVTYAYSDTTGQGNSWSRPYFIAGVSGLGPVDYHELTFQVSESGLYRFESVRDDGDDHWSCLYEGGFDDASPLANLVDYGLGNGFSPFNMPRGTSRFSQLLFAGETYHWVTSQWDSISPNGQFTNTIVGPGAVVVDGGGCNGADIAEPFGQLDFSDVVAFLVAFGAMDPAADVAAPIGQWDFSDVVEFLTLFAQGCP